MESMNRLKRSLSLVFVFALVVGLLPFTTVAQASTGTVVLDPTQGPPETQVIARGSGWTPGDTLQVQWSNQNGRQVLATPTVDANGNFNASFRVPANATLGEQDVSVVDASDCSDLSQVCRGPFAFAKFTVIQSPNLPPVLLPGTIGGFPCATSFAPVGKVFAVGSSLYKVIEGDLKGAAAVLFFPHLSCFVPVQQAE